MSEFLAQPVPRRNVPRKLRSAAQRQAASGLLIAFGLAFCFGSLPLAYLLTAGLPDGRFALPAQPTEWAWHLPLIGAAIALWPAFRRRRAARLLVHGAKTSARVIGMEVSHVEIPEDGKRTFHTFTLLTQDHLRLVLRPQDPHVVDLLRHRHDSGSPVALLSHPRRPRKPLFPELL